MPYRLCLLVFALSLSTVRAQEERVPLYRGPAPTQKEKDCRESLYTFAYGLICQKDDRLIDALLAFEQAAKLDPEAPGAFKAQVPLLLLMDRPRDALVAIKRVLELDPTDHDSWFIAARLHKGVGELKEYRNALDKGLQAPGLVEEKPHIAQQLYFELGQHHELHNELAEAVAAYTASAKILDHPDAILDHGPFVRESIVARGSEMYEKIGDLERQRKRFDAAVAAYRTAQARLPDAAARINFHLARVYQDKGDLAEALNSIDVYLKLVPPGTEAYQVKIDLLQKLKRTGEILPWLVRATKTDVNNIPLKLLLARQYAAQGNIDTAEAVYLAIAEDAPSDDLYRGLFTLPRALPGRFILDQLDKSIRLASKKPPEPGSARASEQTRAILSLLKEDAGLAKQMVDAAYQPDQADRNLAYETRFFLAMFADKHGKLGQAETFYRRAIDASDRMNNEPSLYSGYFRILWRGRKFEEIIRVADKGLQFSQSTAPILFYAELAKAHARLGNFTKALSAAEKAVDNATDANRLFAMHIKIRTLIQAERYATAEEICLKLLTEPLPPGDLGDVRYMLSGVYSAQKKFDKSEAQLLEIIKNDPTNATAHNDLGYGWADRNVNLKEAEELIRKAIDFDRQQRKTSEKPDSDNPAYVDSLGWVLFRRGDLDGAAKELERAVAMPDGDDPTLWDHLGDVYARQGRLVQAQAAYERSVQLFEEERTRSKDERYRETRRKLDQVKTQVRAK